MPSNERPSSFFLSIFVTTCCNARFRLDGVADLCVSVGAEGEGTISVGIEYDVAMTGIGPELWEFWASFCSEATIVDELGISISQGVVWKSEWERWKLSNYRLILIIWSRIFLIVWQLITRTKGTYGHSYILY